MDTTPARSPAGNSACREPGPRRTTPAPPTGWSSASPNRAAPRQRLASRAGGHRAAALPWRQQPLPGRPRGARSRRACAASSQMVRTRSWRRRMAELAAVPPDTPPRPDGGRAASGQTHRRPGRRHRRYRRHLAAGTASPARCPTSPRPPCPAGHPRICCAPPMTPASCACPIPTDPTRGGGFTALGMGKLGAAELNYSSDIDLVLLYDPDRACLYRRTRRPMPSAPSRPGWPADSCHSDGGARRRRLRLPHRSAPAPRPRRHPARDRAATPPSPTTKAWARTGNAPP